MLAEVLQTNQFDSDLLGKLIQIVIVLSALGIGYGINKRKPSLDAELSTGGERMKALGSRLDNLERNTPGNMGKELDDLESQLRRLADRVEVIAANQSKQMAAQAGNTATINHIESTLKAVTDQMQSLVAKVLDLAAHH